MFNGGTPYLQNRTDQDYSITERIIDKNQMLP